MCILILSSLPTFEVVQDELILDRVTHELPI